MAARRKWNDETLSEVARVYLDAVNRAEQTTLAVIARFGCSYPTAGKLVMAARAKGYLPPTVSGSRTAGMTHYPTTAAIYRGQSSRRRTFQVCGHCLVPWPCAEAS